MKKTSKSKFLTSTVALSAILLGMTVNISAQEPAWKNLPPSKQHSPGHVEIPAKLQTPSRDINMVIIVKSETYNQKHNGEMVYGGYHRYGEIFSLPISNLESATFKRVGDERPADEQFTMYPDYRSNFFHGGRYADFDEMEQKEPGEEYQFDIKHSDGRTTSQMVPIPSGERPGPVKLSIYQEDKEIGYTDIDYTKDLIVRWDGFNGEKDPNGIMDDYVTIQLDKCHDNGKRIYTSGVATLNATYLTFEAGEAVIPAETMEKGYWYKMSGKFANVTHTSLIDNAPAVASWMSYINLEVATNGAASMSTCE
ncbi:hypothetical protein [Pseudemcibacter aquimaris]|uniref:hypothetical protein n=1 Tax=Pseudemcibacter aquimaris TaxID=2857064 RepID=UPI0020116670|nr:hypothetical protein [Pseudemcibacter aquimaris]MCC3860296.1 hypothetical protein [Pseudemcibacter aquimaris]WDU57620.1 hypothetical protein KW060_10480 [Pseudemcibacter aquimaris]